MYKYKCTSRYKMLLVVENEIVEIRPQEIVYFNGAITNKFLRLQHQKKVETKSKPVKKTKSLDIDLIAKELKMEKILL